MFDRENSSSTEDIEKKVDDHIERRGSKASARSRVEDLQELPDPDEGKSPEERKKIVSDICALGLPPTLMPATGQSVDVEG